MSEYAEQEWEDEDDYDLEDEIDELRDEMEEQQINATIRDMERAHGAAFTPDEVQEIGRLIDEEGIPAQYILDQLEPATSPGEEAFDNQFIETVEHVSEREGRPLQQSEVDRLYESSVYEGDPRHVEDDAIRDLSKRQDRIAHIDEGIAARDPGPETPELIEPLGEDSTKQERIAYMDARAAGAEVDTYEGDYE